MLTKQKLKQDATLFNHSIALGVKAGVLRLTHVPNKQIKLPL